MDELHNQRPPFLTHQHRPGQIPGNFNPDGGPSRSSIKIEAAPGENRAAARRGARKVDWSPEIGIARPGVVTPVSMCNARSSVDTNVCRASWVPTVRRLGSGRVTLL